MPSERAHQKFGIKPFCALHCATMMPIWDPRRLQRLANLKNLRGTQAVGKDDPFRPCVILCEHGIFAVLFVAKLAFGYTRASGCALGF
ncbi:hypothetical protein Mapa_003422 [Marchantia paleacea]|nr:hypothetical protein Mapa_003422 [Marchantia paleacea]